MYMGVAFIGRIYQRVTANIKGIVTRYHQRKD